MAAGFVITVSIGSIDYLAGIELSPWSIATKLLFLFIILYLLSELKDALKRERELARTDNLTKIANRKSFYDLAASETNRLRRYKHPFTAAYLDIDNLKMVNYRFGYGTGDQLLQSVAEAVKKNIRDVDIVSRFGGDEFALLLPETGAESAQIVLSRLRTKLLDLAQKNEWPVTFSFGVATFISPPESVEAMMKMVSGLMYSAKDAGPNMIDQNVFSQ